MQKEINIRLNVNRAKAVHTGHKFASGDKGIVFKLAVDELDTSNTTAKIVFKRSNGTSVEAGITAEDGIYSYTTLGNEFAVVGQVTADVKFYEGEKRISTCTFVFDVVSDTLDGIGTGTGGYSDTLEKIKKEMEEILSQMKDVMDGAEEDVEAAEQKMAELTADLEALYQEYVEAFGSTGPFNPRGPYSETESYTVRDLVTYDDASWVCYRNCTGATPSKESDCWQYFAVGAEVNLDDIIDGTKQVGDAKKLDGHGVEYFASSEVLNSVGILEKSLTLEIGAYNYHFGNNAVVSDLPNGNYKWGSASVFVRSKGGAVYVILWGVKTEAINCPPTFNYYDGAGWSGWQTLFTMAGGTVESSSVIPFGLKHLGEYGQYIAFSNNLGKLGHLGVDANKKPYFKNAEETANYELLHTGNKPTGTYTGNGDATERIIEVGGLANSVMIETSGYGGSVRLDFHGGVCKNSDGTSVNGISWGEGQMSGGKIILRTTNPLLNASGVTYRYYAI